MSQVIHQTSPGPTRLAAWEDDGGLVAHNLRPVGLSPQPGQEQDTVSRANAAGLEKPRLKARSLGQLVDPAPHPYEEHQAFRGGDGLIVEGWLEGELLALERLVERDARDLIRAFAAGAISAKAFEHRSRIVRQDRARLLRHSLLASAEEALENASKEANVTPLEDVVEAKQDKLQPVPASVKPQSKHFTAFRSAAEEIAAAAKRHLRSSSSD